MTREEAKQAVEVLKAFADGKDIEFSNKVGTDFWKRNENPNNVNFNFARYDYRVAKEPQYRPFENAEECWSEMLKHQPFGWVKDTDNGSYLQIYGFRDNIGIDHRIYEWFEAFRDVTFADGEPFGIKIE